MSLTKSKSSNNLQQTASMAKMPHATVAQLKSHEGPLPDPESLSQYESISPGFANRIMTMAEDEQKHRHDAENSVIVNQHIQHKRDTDTFRWGQFYALLSVGGVIALCWFMVSKNCSTAAATLGVAAIVGVIVAFHNKNPNKANSQQKQAKDSK